jgi:hypothetical protein
MAKILNDYPSVALKPEDLEGKIDFAQIVGRKNSVHIEIGSGKAAFLLNQAIAQPDVNFLGIEWARKYYRYAIDRIGRWGLKNVKIIRTDAVHFIINFVPDSSIECFHIYFPDPCTKDASLPPQISNSSSAALSPQELSELLPTTLSISSKYRKSWQLSVTGWKKSISSPPQAQMSANGSARTSKENTSKKTDPSTPPP